MDTDQRSPTDHGPRHGGSRLTALDLPLFKALCGHVGSTGPERRPILLKNTWDFSNIALIHRLVPQGRFICIHRHPHAVLTSMFRAAQSMLGAYNPYVGLLSRSYRRFATGPLRRPAAAFCRWAPQMLARGLIHWSSRQVSGHLEGRKQVASDACLDVHYEDLCARPDEVMKAIFDWLHLPLPARDFQAMIKPRGGGTAPEIAREAAFIRRRFGKYAARFNYDLAAS